MFCLMGKVNKQQKKNNNSQWVQIDYYFYYIILAHLIFMLFSHVYFVFLSSHLFYNFNKLQSSEACHQTLESTLKFHISVQLPLTQTLSLFPPPPHFFSYISFIFLSRVRWKTDEKKKYRTECHETFMWINISFATILCHPIKAYKLSAPFFLVSFVPTVFVIKLSKKSLHSICSNAATRVKLKQVLSAKEATAVE